MNRDAPEMVESRLLIRKFFPESQSTVHTDRAMCSESLRTAKAFVPHWKDCTCEASYR